MNETVVLSQQSVPPAIYPASTLFDQLTAWQTAILAAGIRMKLFKNSIIVSALTTLADLEEAGAPGYAPVVLSSLDGPYVDQSGNAYSTTQLANFVCSGGGSDLIYGAYIVEDTGSPATATFTESGGAYTAPVITSPGSGYLVPPKVTPTGATGSGAKLSAVITNGQVTAINIDSPGTGYTTATATIEAPNKLIDVGNFPAAKPLQAVSDAIQVVFELDILAVA